MFIRRSIGSKVKEAAQEYPVIAIMGPRQSGKTTLAEMEFPEHAYISLEDYDIRALAKRDPREFLSEYASDVGVILDEIQHVPELLSYMQTIVDKQKRNGFFILTGSQNFLVDQAITQTLAGRMAVFTLLPLSIAELEKVHLLPEKIVEFIYKGAYPKIYSQDATVSRLYANYLRLYVERDVRQIANVSDLETFQRFMRMCAGRIGQVLNLTSLGNDCGINHNTAKAWISILQASYVVFLLYPYYNNFGKRLVKSPKMYFIDTGIACTLLKIRSPEELLTHYMRGSLVESLIISDFLKQQYNLEQDPSLYFWRDKPGNEIDCIVDVSKGPVPVEIKAGKTVATDYFKNINYWKKSTGLIDRPSYVVYGGNDNQKWPEAQVLSWKSAGDLIKRL